MKAYLSEKRRTAAQAMIEFALVFPILLLLLYGIIEIGRLIYIYSSVTTASREASRFGSAAGGLNEGAPRYLDSAGMRLAARRALIAIDVPDDDIDITYDCGPATSSSTSFQSCNSNQAARVVISISATYEPIFNTALFEIPIIPITAASSRTIMRDISIVGTPAPVGVGTPDVYFRTTEFITTAESGTIGVEVRLTSTSSAPVTVYLAVAGTATGGVDYTLSENPVTIPANNISRTVSIAIVEDLLPEYNETVTLTIDNAVGALVGTPNVFNLTITDDDPPPYVVFTSPASTVSEAGIAALISVELRSQPDGSGNLVPAPDDLTIFFNRSGTAVNGIDYTLPYASLTIPAGTTSGLFSINIIDDAADPVDEVDKNVLLTVNSVTGLAQVGTTSHDLLIMDNETSIVSWGITDFALGERSGPVTVRVNIFPRSEQDIQLAFTRGGTATSGTDYSLTASPITIGAFTTGFDLTLDPVDDAIVESETIILTMSSATNAQLSSDPTLVITLEDGIVIQPITVRAFTPNSYVEGSTVPVTFLAGGPVIENVTINFTLGGTASYTGTASYVAGHIDYNIPVQSVTIPRGSSSATVNMTLTADNVDEADETVSITIQSLSSTNAIIGAPASQTFTIVDANISPQVAFTSVTRSYYEGLGRVEIPLAIYPVSDQNITLSFYYAITSTASSDPTSLFYAYDVISQTVFVPSYTSVISLPVGLPDNFIVDQPERVLYIQIGTITPSSAAQRANPYQFEMRIAEVDVCATAGAIASYGDNQKKIAINVLNTATNNRPLVLSGVQIYETAGRLPPNQYWTNITYSSMGTFTLPSPQLLNMSSPYTSIAPAGVTYDLPQNGTATIIFSLSKNLGANTRYTTRLIFQDAISGSTFTCPLIIAEP